MIKTILTPLLFFVLIIPSATAFTLEDVRTVKKSKLYVGLPSDEKVAEELKNAVESLWKFTPIAGYLPLKEALEKSKNDENVCVMYIDNRINWSLNRGTGEIRVKTYAASTKLIITNGKKKELCDTFLSAYKGNVLGIEGLFQAVGTMNDYCKTIDEQNLSSNWKMAGVFKERGPSLANKILLLNDEWVDDKLTDKEIEEAYPGKIKRVSYDVFVQEITNKNPDYAYVLINVLSAGGKYRFFHVISDAETGIVYSMPNSTFQADNNSYRLIGLKNIKLYSKTLEK